MAIHRLIFAFELHGTPPMIGIISQKVGNFQRLVVVAFFHSDSRVDIVLPNQRLSGGKD